MTNIHDGELSVQDIEKLIEKMFTYIHDKNVNNEKKNQDKINNLLSTIKKGIMMKKIDINNDIRRKMTLDNLSRNSDNNLTDKELFLQKKLKLLSDEVILMDNYTNSILNLKQKQTLDTLTIINTIFLPLALITSFFSLNLGFKIQNRLFIVIGSYIVSILIVVILFKFNFITG